MPDDDENFEQEGAGDLDKPFELPRRRRDRPVSGLRRKSYDADEDAAPVRQAPKPKPKPQPQAQAPKPQTPAPVKKKKPVEVVDSGEDSEDGAEDHEDEYVDVSRFGGRLVDYSTQKGFFMDFVDEARTILFQPHKFFEEMPAKGGLKGPTMFALVCALIYAPIQAMLHANGNFGGFILVFLTCILNVLVTVVVASVVLNFALKKLGGTGTFEGTYRAIAFGKATVLIAWLSFGPIPIGGVLSMAYSVYLNILAIERLHKLPRKLTAMLVGVVAVLGFAVKMRLPF